MNVFRFQGIIIFVFFVFVTSVNAQKFKRVLGRPVAFAAPLNNSTYYLSSTKDRESSIPWVVICDRSNPDRTKTYAEPSESSHTVKTLKFKDWFYVLEENGDWIRIGKATMKSGVRIASNFKDFGWIKKENMLLWTTGFLNSRTQISQKAFLKADKNFNQIIKFYKGPYTGELIEKKSIYDFYFILKSENDRYLLAKRFRLSPRLSADWDFNLLGWVAGHRVIEWDTQICLEPNFEQKAFDERKQNKSFRLIGFTSEMAAKSYAFNGVVDSSSIAWDLDKIKFLEKSNLRYPGNSFRLLFIGNSNSNFKTLMGNSSTGFKEIYIPKKIKGAKYPTYSCVLFMPDEDLDRYTNRIEQIAYAVNGATPAELRQEIYFMFIDLLEYYTGDINDEKNEKMSTEDIRRIMHGMENEGFADLGKSTDFVIKDILSKKKMPDEKVRIFSEEILENARKLKKVQKQGKDYEFSYTSGGNTYFWIPIDWTF